MLLIIMSELEVVIEEGIEPEKVYDNVMKALSLVEEFGKLKNKDSFKYLNRLFAQKAGKRTVLCGSHSTVTNDTKMDGVTYFDMPNLKGKSGLLDEHVWLCHIFHKKGKKLLPKAIMDAFIKFTGVDQSRVSSFNDHDIELDKYKIGGVSAVIFNSAFVFELGGITLEKDEKFFRGVLSDGEYNRTIFINNQPRDRYGSTGVINHFPDVDRKALFEEILNNLKTMIKELPDAIEDEIIDNETNITPKSKNPNKN